MDLAISYDGLEEISSPVEYITSVKEWVEKARETALEKVNNTQDKDASQFNAHRREISFLPGDLILEWKPVSVEGLATKLLSKWVRPIPVVTQTSPVNYKIKSLRGKGHAHIVHVERLKRFNKRTTPEAESRKFGGSDPDNSVAGNEEKSINHESFVEDKSDNKSEQRFPKRMSRKPERLGYNNGIANVFCLTIETGDNQLEWHIRLTANKETNQISLTSPDRMQHLSPTADPDGMNSVTPYSHIGLATNIPGNGEELDEVVSPLRPKMRHEGFKNSVG
jgi:hypothetical protein